MASKKISTLIASAMLVGTTITGNSIYAEVQSLNKDHSASPLITKGDSKLKDEYSKRLSEISKTVESKSSEMVEEKNKRLIEEKIREELLKKTEGTNYKIIPGTMEDYSLTAYTMEEEGWTFGGIAADAVTKMYEANLRNRYIAVDRNKTPLGSKLYIEFPEDIRFIIYEGESFDLNGVYTAVDVGGAIRENKIDLYVGSFGQHQLDIAYMIGRRNVKVYKVEER